MAKKRLFQILDEMNVADGINHTGLVGVSGSFVEGKMSKAGALITMGTEHRAITEIVQATVIPILLLIDSIEYNRLKGEDLQETYKIPDPENDYVPFGPEWEAELMKFTKKDLVKQLRKTLMLMKENEDG